LKEGTQNSESRHSCGTSESAEGSQYWQGTGRYWQGEKRLAGVEPDEVEGPGVAAILEEERLDIVGGKKEKGVEERNGFSFK